MGGMFSVLKVRKEQKPGDYSDPGWYAHPKGEVAFEWDGVMPAAKRAAAGAESRGQSMPASAAPAPTEIKVRKPNAHAGH